MPIKLDNEIGKININDYAISAIAGISAMECYGLVGMAAKSSSKGLARLLKNDNMHRGVKVYLEDNSIIIDLYVIIQFGTKVSVVANNIKDKVKYNVERQTGIKVKKVNVNIKGVRVLKA